MVVISCKKGKFTYVLAKNKINSEDFGTAVVYGISIIDKKKVTAVEDLIVEEELCPEHLYDIVEDLLSETLLSIMSLKAEDEHPYIA